MARLEIKYRLEGKALPPRPIRVAVPGWGGSPAVKKENGSQPQPWHCPLFVDGVTQGVELLYQYETECHVVNDGGQVRVEWDREAEPGGGTSASDFTLSAPPPSTEYLFATSIDLQAPPGYVLRTETHPRFFHDPTGTVPAAFYGHVRSEWWPKKLFVVFKIPAPGQRHVFRKGEPYAQVLFIPRDDYALTPMTDEEADRRRRLEADIKRTKSLVAKHVWNSAGSNEFNDHYKVLARAYEQGGLAAVEAVVQEGLAAYRAAVPEGKTVDEYAALAADAQAAGRFVEAKEILHHALAVDPRCPEAHARMAALQWEQGVHAGAVASMAQAVALRPTDPRYRMNLAEFHHRLGRPEAAVTQVRAAVALRPNDPQLLEALGYALSQQGGWEEAVALCRRAAALAPAAPSPRYVLGLIYGQIGRQDEARAAFEAALAIDPTFAPARQSLLAAGHAVPPEPTAS